MERVAQQCKQCGREIYFDGICISCRTENERNRILALTQEEMDVSIQQICNEIEIKGKLDEERDLFQKLLNYRDIDTQKIAEVAFKNNLFYPCELYKDAPADVITEMIEMIMQDNLNSRLAGHLLLCLAVHGGETVFQSFLELEKHPRNWRKELYVSPSFYATYGGWSYDNSHRFIETNFKKCYPMVKGTLDEKNCSPVKIGVKTDEKCSKCGCRIVNLMEIDGRDPRLDFLEIDGVIKVKCCPNCFEYSDGDFCRYKIDGESELISGNDSFITEDYLKDKGIEELASNSYILGDIPVPPRYAADWEGGSSIGGFAFWIQDCDIKLCPDCGKPMKYLAQIQWDTVLDDMEGNAYIEICKSCQVIGVLHQQT
ncbi:hypothetical protein [Anaerosporobacter sp.]|uniref:hypothetical protein n=1 Tax=Anaerosporobacter sp. TaxID=1872529 RepID=UPI00286F4864|nr:hypothetical protein [Anaerosporobacter sp.]